MGQAGAWQSVEGQALSTSGGSREHFHTLTRQSECRDEVIGGAALHESMGSTERGLEREDIETESIERHNSNEKWRQRA